MKLITVASLLQQSRQPLPSLAKLIGNHLERIQPNIGYAVAQDNNHGTTEAAGLYVGATWLYAQQESIIKRSTLNRWRKQGRTILEERILRLIGKEGSFSQKSVNYHRVVTDTMSWTLHAMEELNEPDFNEAVRQRIRKLAEWQFKMIAGKQGEAPNLGSNDGAMLEKLHNCDYQDFRASTQLIFGLLEKCRVFHEGDWDEALFWRIGQGYSSLVFQKIDLPAWEVFDDQYLVMRNNDVKLYMILPHDRFRPNSCDAFHLDFWVNGENLFCDQGTYSYNAGKESSHFKSVRSHNTIQLGELEQMPKLSRFLYGNWLKTTQYLPIVLRDNRIIWEGNYVVKGMYKHSRKITLSAQSLDVMDRVDSKFDLPVTVRWHSPILKSENLRLQDDQDCGLPLTTELKDRSLYYLNKAKVNVFTYSGKNRTIKTTLSLI